MCTDEAKEEYKLTKQLVEPVFGIIKEQQQARRFLLRGRAKVAAEWSLLATAFNLRTLWRVWRSRTITPGSCAWGRAKISANRSELAAIVGSVLDILQLSRSHFQPVSPVGLPSL